MVCLLPHVAVAACASARRAADTNAAVQAAGDAATAELESTDGGGADGEDAAADAGSADGPLCGEPLSFCDAECVDVRHDPDHCGACGVRCEAWQSCDEGECQAAGCEAGRVRCEGVCIDADRSRAHCGATRGCAPDDPSEWGELCGPWQTCRSGDCVDCAPFGRPALLRLPTHNSGCHGLVAGDLDGDGDDDLVTDSVNSYARPWVLLQEPHGLEAAHELVPLDYSWGVRLEDLDGDDVLDLAPRKYWDGLDVRLGVGDGTFRQVAFEGVPEEGDAGWAVRLNADAYPDLWRVDETRVTVALGVEGYTFGDAQVFELEAAPAGLGVADFTGDGVVDILTGREDDAGLWLFRGSAQGAFDDPVSWSLDDGQTEVAGVADFDGDGHQDVLLAHSARGGWPYPGMASPNYDWLQPMRRLRGHGDGTFDSPVRLPHDGSPGLAELADVDGDGHVDIVTTLVPRAQSEWGFLRNRGDGTFERAVYYALGTGIRNWPRAALADVTGDGVADLLACQGVRLPGSLAVFPAVAPGQFEAPRLHVVGGEPSWSLTHFRGRLALADLEGDGVDEVLWWDRQAIWSVAFSSDGVAVRPLVEGPSGVDRLAAAELDGDGALDLFAMVEGGALRSWLGDGKGSFHPGPTGEVGQDSNEVLGADLDGDGRDEILVHTDAGLEVWRWMEGALTLHARLPLPRDAWRLHAADFDEDGHDDLVFYGDGSTHVWLTNEDGEPRPAAVLTEAYLQQVSDVDGDGHVDVVAGGLRRGRGDGSFEEPAGHGGRFVADVDGDGRADFVSQTETSIVINYGDGQGGWVAGPQLLVRGALSAVRDLDGDGHVDLLYRQDEGLVLERGRGAEGCP